MLKYLYKNEYFVAIIAILLFIPFLGSVHLFDWDEINFAESAREMIATGNYFKVQINFSEFTEKPPFFFWLQVLSMKAFGVNEFAARFPNAICGIVSLIVFYKIGKALFNETFARIWVMIYLGTIATFLYFKSGIIDPWYNLFTFLSIYFFYLITVNKNVTKNAILSGTFLGLAVLTKGPVAILICLLSLTTFIVLTRFKIKPSWKSIGWVVLFTFLVSFTWYGIDLIENGPKFILEFLRRQYEIFSTSDADHGEPFFYHWWVLLIGCFPASVFFIGGFFVKFKEYDQRILKLWMHILFWVTLLLFSIVKTKIVHYSSLCWFPITFIASCYVYELKNIQFSKWWHVGSNILIGVIGGILSIALTAIPFVMMQKEKWIHLVEDDFAVENLKALVQWSWVDSIGGLVMLSGLIVYLINRNEKAIVYLFSAMTVCVYLTSVRITPKIEAISQRANIEFFQQRIGEDCYVGTYGFKSYVPPFYSLRQPGNSDLQINEKWLTTGNIDKPAYIVAKKGAEDFFAALPDVEKLYDKNGFVFYKRTPIKK